MRVAITLSLCALLSVSPVLAAPLVTDQSDSAAIRPGDACGWSAQMEEDEGGPVMVASSCGSDTETGPAFRLLCGDGINIRYNSLAMGDAAPPASSTMVVSAGGKSLTTDAVFEEMDGAYAAYVEPGSPIIAMLQGGSEIGVTLGGADLPARKVSLKGSSAAIGKLMQACE